MDNLIHFDYLGLTLHPHENTTPIVVAAHLSAFLGEEFEKGRAGLRGYDASYLLPTTRCTVLYGGVSQRGTIHIIITGSGCRVLGETKIRSLCDYLDTCGSVSCTRMDIAVDVAGLDWRREVSDIAQYVVSPFVRKYKEVSTRDLKSPAVLDSRTLYFGSRESERMVRIYGKQTDDGQDYTRCEVEVKADLAAAYFSAYMVDTGRSVRQLAVSAFDRFFDVEIYLGVSLTSLYIPVDTVVRLKSKRTVAWALSCSGALTDVISYYGQNNFMNMLKEREQDKRLAKLSHRRTPVGNTGVTNIEFPQSGKGDLPPLSFEEYQEVVRTGQGLMF